jgi:hypothetical protein
LQRDYRDRLIQTSTTGTKGTAARGGLSVCGSLLK